MKEVRPVIKFIEDYFKRAGRRAAIVGLSGGLDSAVTVVLCSQALGPRHVYPVYLPYQPLAKFHDLVNIKKVLKLAKIPEKHLISEDITNPTNAFKKKHPKISKIDLGNKMARERMSLLYYHARRLKGLVVGTSNRTERLLGYFTLHGDGAWDLAPIAHLYKSEIRQLAKKLNLPEAIIAAPPTAGLWPGQTDEAELGFTYEQADKVLRQFIDQKKPAKQIEKSNLPAKTISRILKRHRLHRFRLQSPVKIG